MRSLAVGLLAALLLTSAGCSGKVEVGALSVKREKVEQGISSQLATSVGREPESVVCPDDLPGKVDEKMRCTLTDSGTELGVTVTVTSIEGKTVNFSAVVDDLPDAE